MKDAAQRALPKRNTRAPRESRGPCPKRATRFTAAPLHIYTLRNMFLCVRTTIDLPDELFRLVKKRAAEENITLRELIERALRSHLGGKKPRKGHRLKFRPFRGKGLQPGVTESDLSDRDRLFDLMEGRR
jgi:hypothetical protein